MRERLFTMRLSEEESKRLEAVAAHYGLNAAGVLRMLLKREESAIIAGKEETAPAKPGSESTSRATVAKWQAAKTAAAATTRPRKPSKK